MTEVLIAVGALLAFSLLAFGAACLMAAWMGDVPIGIRRRRRDRG